MYIESWKLWLDLEYWIQGEKAFIKTDRKYMNHHLSHPPHIRY